MLVFVYGTLMRGGCRHPALANETFVGNATTKPCYRLYDCGSYPGLVASDDGLCIEGELWQVGSACLARLDEIEGVDEGLYERRRIRLQHPAVDEPVEAYLYLHDIAPLPDLGTRWNR